MESIASKIQAIIGRDIGRRGIAAITLPGQLEVAARNFVQSESVVVLTGFPCRINDSPPTETDGPPGAVALARAARKLGKPAAIAVDESSEAVLRACADAVGLSTDSGFEILSFPARESFNDAAKKKLLAAAAKYNHAVAIERSGRAVDGSYYTMRGFSMDHLVAPIDELLTLGTESAENPAWKGHAAAIDYTTTPELADAVSKLNRTCTGIGDGGNECGMGKVVDAVRAHINNGEKIACVCPCDALVTAGVSNWGGYGLVAACEALCTSEEAAGTSSKGAPGWLLPTEEEEKTLSAAMAAAGARDGISGNMDGSVDGMPLETHLAVLEELKNILRGE